MSDRQFGKVRFVCGKNGGKYPYNHSLYFRGDRIRAVLDPASSQDKMLGLKDEGVDEVWLSHWHEDHIHYMNLFESSDVRISERDFPPLTDLDTFLDWYGIEDPAGRGYWKKEMVETFDFRPRKTARFFRDDELIDLGGLTVQVIPTPGHTPGHLSFYVPEEGLLFVGDYDLTSFGPWYGDVIASPAPATRISRRRRTRSRKPESPRPRRHPAARTSAESRTAKPVQFPSPRRPCRFDNYIRRSI